MAGPSLSHILDPPQPTARSGHYAASQPYVRHDSDSNRTHAATPTSTSLSSSVSPRIQQKTPTSVSPSAPATASPAVAPTSAPPAAVSGVAAAAASAGTHGQQAASSPAPSQSNHSGNNLYACRDCGRSYSRPEHLVRHVQTHTLGRRFTCDICQKSFARKDLLRRHVANHDNDSPKKRRRTTTSPGAGRVSHACRSCAVARVKCDDQKPCKRCVSRKLTCVSSEAPSTAAMHLMHLSANSHSVSANNGINPTGNDGDKPATTHSSTASTGSASPAPYSQARPMPVLPAPSQGTAIVDRTIAGSPALPPMNPDDSQLPTPESIGDQGYGTDYAPPSLAESLPSLAASNRLPFPEFLRNVLFENQMDPGRMTDYQGLGILDFCDNVSLEMTDADFGLLDYWNTEGLNSAVDGHSRSDSSSDSSHLRQSFAKLWANSPWSWDGRSRESSYRNSASPPMGRELVERTVPERLEQSARDRVLALVLGNCRQNSSLNRVASSFPSTEVMDTLIHNFLSCLARQSSEWIHFPSFRLNEQWPEWIAMAAATGAVLTPIPTLHRFGFALQDAVRLSLLGRFQDTSSPIQDMGLVQALILVQDIGLWSGNRRKMEIAECHLGIPVTMMRYRGKFQKSSYPVRAVEPSDEGSLLEDKWRKWVERERWKRLVFHCYLRDAQCSLTTLTNPNMSYAELTLPMPEPRELWHAMSAVEWKSEYLARHNGANIRPPSVGDLLHEVQVLPANHQRVDMQLSIAIYLHGVWALILEYQQLSAVHRARSYSGSVAGNQGLLLNSRHQELVKDLSNFHLMSADWPDMTPQEHLMLSLLLMHLHVSMDDLQLFAGKEGEDQARRTLPVLQQWANSPEARSALWYAGQVMRHAKSMAPGQLKDFCAVGVHQACMTLWTYGIVTKADRRHQQPLPGQFGWELVYLDGTDTMSIQRFVGFGQGRPAIQGPVVRDATSEAPLAEPKACVDIAQDILRGNFRNRNGTEGVPPIVENLCRLIKQLGDAAWTVGLG